MSNKHLNATLIILMIHLAFIALILPSTLGSNILYVASYIVFYAFPIAFSALKLRDDGEHYFKVKRLSFTDLYYICFFFVIFVVISPILTLIFPDDIPDYSFSPLMLIISGFLAPILEELLWRGVVFKKLSKYSTVFAMIFSSLLFALLHAGSAGLIYAFLGGMIFSLLYIKTGSILPGILLHLANNLVATLSIVFPLVLRIALTASLAIVILAHTNFKRNLNTARAIEYTPFNTQILFSPFVYLLLIFVVMLRYL